MGLPRRSGWHPFRRRRPYPECVEVFPDSRGATGAARKGPRLLAAASPGEAMSDVLSEIAKRGAYVRVAPGQVDPAALAHLLTALRGAGHAIVSEKTSTHDD